MRAPTWNRWVHFVKLGCGSFFLGRRLSCRYSGMPTPSSPAKTHNLFAGFVLSSAVYSCKHLFCFWSDHGRFSDTRAIWQPFPH